MTVDYRQFQVTEEAIKGAKAKQGPNADVDAFADRVNGKTMRDVVLATTEYSGEVRNAVQQFTMDLAGELGCRTALEEGMRQSYARYTSGAGKTPTHSR